MPRKEREAVLKGSGPISQDAGKMIPWEELRRVVKSTLGEVLKEIKDDLRSMEQRVAWLEHDAR